MIETASARQIERRVRAPRDAERATFVQGYFKSKRDERVLTGLLDRHAPAMPRTMLRYAIERLSPTQRQRYMAVPRSTRR